eukprot:1124337-Pyramimonas_sp.AAC.1
MRSTKARHTRFAPHGSPCGDRRHSSHNGAPAWERVRAPQPYGPRSRRTRSHYHVELFQRLSHGIHP